MSILQVIFLLFLVVLYGGMLSSYLYSYITRIRRHSQENEDWLRDEIYKLKNDVVKLGRKKR